MRCPHISPPEATASGIKEASSETEGPFSLRHPKHQKPPKPKPRGLIACLAAMERIGQIRSLPLLVRRPL